MKNSVRWVALLMSCLLLLGIPAIAADTDILISPAPVYVKLRVESVSKNLIYKKLAVQSGTAVMDAVKLALDEQHISYRAADSRFTSIAGETEGMFGGKDGWVFCVNNVPQPASVAGYALRGGESILLCYGDFSGMPATLLPHISAARGADGLVTLTAAAQRLTYDGQWNPVYSTVPVAGAALKAGGGSYVTDGEGKAVLSAEDSARESLPVQLSQKAADGKPLAVRLEPDFALDLSGLRYITFSDISNGKWYDAAVTDISARGAIKGYDDGTFRPMKPLTRAEAAAVLARLSGAELSIQPAAAFTDVSQDQWYAKYINWAANTGIVNGTNGAFMPEALISRQDLCVMLTRYADTVMKKTLPADHAAPVFDDAENISYYAAEAVYRLQKAGVAEGSEAGFFPRENASRAEFCVFLQRLLTY